MKLKQFLILSAAFIFFYGCKPSFNSEITESELIESLDFLASDSLKGRFPGTAEDHVLIQHIVNEFDKAGLTLMADQGKQEFAVSRGFIVTEKNKILIGEKELTGGKDYRVMGFSSTDTVTGKLIIGSTSSPKNIKGISGAIIMLPFPADIPEYEYDVYNTLRSAALTAADQGVAAVIFVYKDTITALDHPLRLPLSIPAAAMKVSTAAQIVNFKNGQSLNDILESSEKNAHETGITLTIESEVISKKIYTNNSVALLNGSTPELAGQYVIIGAHHDHLGMGGRGSSSRRQDTIAIHYGADDNASGVTGVIEIAQNMVNRSPGRSFVFMTFGAEELGLYGSKYFNEHPTVDLSQVQVMINLDMIGRMKEDKRQLQIGGIGTSPVFRALIDTLNTNYNFNIAYAEAGYGPSDHSSFYAKDVPVLFISTGAHPDYHTPADSKEKINYAGMVEVVKFVSDLAFELANLPEKIEFTIAGPKKPSGSRSRTGGVTFGLMPDVIYDGNEGMPVSFVTAGKPAAVGGMKDGDIIIAVDGKQVGNIQDYMQRLSELKEGQSVVVSIKRDDTQLDLLLKL